MHDFQRYLHTCMAHFEFPEEARAELSAAYMQVFSEAANLRALSEAMAMYEADKQGGCIKMLSLCKELSACSDVHIYVVYALVLTMMAEVSKVHYQKEGVPLSIWKENFLDLKYKLVECKLVKGIWGIFVPEWYLGFLTANRFSFGRLQFELIDFGHSYNRNLLVLNEKSPVINMHIPRTGTRLTPADVENACERAAVFFKEKYALERSVFVCHSWLLYPANKEMLSPTSNLYSFLSRFDIVEVGEYPDYKEVWRLFDCDYTGEVSRLPADTSLRRAYIDRIQRGEKTGWGYGVFVYETGAV